jgi:uncharacterized RDD family membrane protein YckC
MSIPPPPPSFGSPPPPSFGSPPPPGYVVGGAAGPYASFGARLGGWLLDSLLYGLALSVFAIPAVVLGVAAFDGCVSIERADNTAEIVCPAGKPDGGLLAAAIVLGLIGIVVVAVLYLRALGRTGQTWGRKIVGVKVVGQSTGQPIGFGKAFLRQLVANVASSAICYLGFLWMLWDKDKQTWHDKIVSSIVVKV